MKILYLVPKINAEGGLERVLSLKANYLVEKFHHEVSIMTQNEGSSSLFYPLNDTIQLYDIDLSGTRLEFVAKYCKGVARIITLVNPDIVLVADSMYKAYLVSLVVKNKPIVYECHNSIFVKQTPKHYPFYLNWIPKFDLWFNRYVAQRMNAFVSLSKESLAEWGVPNGIVIPNPNWLETERTANFEAKKIIIVARHSYEKGLDRFFPIWKVVSQNHPDWIVEIYGKSSSTLHFQDAVNQLGIADSVVFMEPIKTITEKYLEASIYVMTSRFEAFPMVLIEAMSCGLPVIAYDCPCGPRAIIENEENGFLIENGNQNQFISTLQKVMESSEVRKAIGANAKKSTEKYAIDTIMNQWNSFLQSKMK